MAIRIGKDGRIISVDEGNTIFADEPRPVPPIPSPSPTHNWRVKYSIAIGIIIVAIYFIFNNLPPSHRQVISIAPSEMSEDAFYRRIAAVEERTGRSFRDISSSVLGHVLASGGSSNYGRRIYRRTVR